MSPAEIPVAGPQGVQGVAGPPGPAIGTSGRHYLALTAANTGYTTPSVAGLQLTTAVRLACLLVCTNWATGAIQVLGGKWALTTANKSYKLDLNTDGTLRVSFSDGTNIRVISASVTMPSLGLSTYTPVYVWCDLVSNNGSGQSQANFYYSYDGVGINPIHIGAANRTNASPGPFAVNSTLVSIGQESAGANPFTTGRLYEFEIWDGTPTLLARFDARGLTTPTDYTDTVGTLGVTWTHGSASAVFQDTLNNLDFLDGSVLEKKVATGFSAEFDLAKNGAALDGVTNDSTVVAAAVASGKDIIILGPCAINADVLVLRPGVKLRGDGFDTAGGDDVAMTQGSFFVCVGAGTNLCDVSGHDTWIDGVGFDGATLCSGAVLLIDSYDGKMSWVNATRPKAAGFAIDVTANGSRIEAEHIRCSGNFLAGTTAFRTQGADGKYSNMRPSHADTNMMIFSGGDMFSQIHMSCDPITNIGIVICCSKAFIQQLQIDNGLNVQILFDPSAKSGGVGHQTIDTVQITGLQNTIGKLTAPDNVIVAVRVNSGTGSPIKNVKIEGTAKAQTTNRFAAWLDPGSDPTKLKGWDLDVNYMNPGGVTAEPIIGGWRPDRYAIEVSVDSGANTFTTLTPRPINVKQNYRALGDGSTNDTAQVVAALTEAAATGAKVYFPASLAYMVTDLSVPANVHLLGDGGDEPASGISPTLSSIIRAIAGTTTLVTLAGRSSGLVALALDGATRATTVLSQLSTDQVIDRCVLWNGVGKNLLAQTTADRARIVNSRLFMPSGGLVNASFDAHDMTISDTKIIGAIQPFIASSHCGGSQFDNLHITGNANTTAAATILSIGGLIFNGVYFDTAGSGPLVILGDDNTAMADHLFDGCKFYNPSMATDTYPAILFKSLNQIIARISVEASKFIGGGDANRFKSIYDLGSTPGNVKGFVFVGNTAVWASALPAAGQAAPAVCDDNILVGMTGDTAGSVYIPASLDSAFATGGRPSASAVGVGARIYDQTLSKPIWSDGATWRDATGAVV